MKARHNVTQVASFTLTTVTIRHIASTRMATRETGGIQMLVLITYGIHESFFSLGADARI
jgi:hypothetical protein